MTFAGFPMEAAGEPLLSRPEILHWSARSEKVTSLLLLPPLSPLPPLLPPLSPFPPLLPPQPPRQLMLLPILTLMPILLPSVPVVIPSTSHLAILFRPDPIWYHLLSLLPTAMLFSLSPLPLSMRPLYHYYYQQHHYLCYWMMSKNRQLRRTPHESLKEAPVWSYLNKLTHFRLAFSPFSSSNGCIDSSPLENELIDPFKNDPTRWVTGSKFLKLNPTTWIEDENWNAFRACRHRVTNNAQYGRICSFWPV